MSIDESTDSILRGAEIAHDNVENASTEALINEDYIESSTGSLVNKDVKELLNRVFIQVPSWHDSFTQPRLSPHEMNGAWNESDPRRNVSLDKRIPFLPIFKPEITGEEEEREEELAQTPQANPILSMVYNRLQVFLLRNGMSLEFLKIFKQYMRHLVESGLDPLGDQYFLSLQNELSESFEFTPVMEDILNKFLFRPENLIMKLTLFERNRTHNLLRRYLRTWKLHNELKRSLQRLGRVWHEYLQRKFLNKWVQNYENCTLIWVNQALEFNKFTLLSSGIDKWLDRIDATDARKGLADHYFLNHIFQGIKGRINSLNLIMKRSQEFNEKRLLKWATRAWRLKDLSARFDGANLSIQKKMFVKMRWKLMKFRALEERAVILNYSLQVSPFIKKWILKARAQKDQSLHLIILEQSFIKKKTFQILKAQLERKQQEYIAVSHLDLILVEFTFQDLWLKKFRKQLHLYSFWNIQGERTVRRLFVQWKKRFFISLKAHQFARIHVLKDHLRVWKFQLKCNVFIAKEERKSVGKIFANWSDRSLQKKRIRQFLLIFEMKPIFALWKSRRDENVRLENLAVSSREYMMKNHFIFHWHHKLQLLRAMNQRADILQKLRAIMIFKRGIAHSQEVERMGDSFAKLLVSKVFLSKYFEIWIRRHVLLRQQKAYGFLENYQKEKNNLLQGKLLALWNQRTQFYRDDCFVKAKNIHQRSLQKSVFREAEQKFHHNEVLAGISNEFRTKSLLLAVFYTWNAHLEQLKEMDARLEVEFNRKNLALLLNYMNNWSMRILKSRRNQETVQVFRNRWDRATVRGLLLVWKTRVDQSPERHRERMRQNAELKTPIRKVSPRSSSTIPGSEGIKMHRIEAMKSHYSRVRRAIPSPVKSSLSLNSTAKKKIETEKDNVFFATNQQQRQRMPPPPRLSLEKINKNLASKIDRINFERIPEVRLEPFMNSDSQLNPIIDRSLLKVDEEDSEFDESPTRRS